MGFFAEFNTWLTALLAMDRAQSAEELREATTVIDRALATRPQLAEASIE